MKSIRLVGALVATLFLIASFGGAANAASANPPNLVFVAAPLNATSSQNVSITVDAGYSIAFATGTALNPPFALDIDTCAGFAGPGTCNIRESFTPTSLGAAGAAATLNVWECPLAGPCINIPVTIFGQVVVDFGLVPLNTSSTRDVTIIVDAGFAISSLGIGGPFGIDFDTCGGFRGPGSCNIKATFTPTAVGFANTAANMGECVFPGPGPCIFIPVPLQGSGVSRLSASPPGINFGQVLLNTSATQNVTITLDAGYYLASVGIGGPFNISFDTCSGFRGPGTCNIKATFTPIAAGPANDPTSLGECPVPGPGTCHFVTVPLSGAGVSLPPAMTKSFGAARIGLLQSTSLTFTVTNPPGNAVPLNGINFFDTLPAGLVVASPSGVSGFCGGGGITAVSGSSSVALSNGAVAVGGSCTFSVNVTGTTAGVKLNTVAATATESGSTIGAAANASITVVSPPNMVKAFGAASIGLLQSTSLSFTVTNPAANPISLSGVAFTDTLPAGLAVATPNGLSGSCGFGVITATSGAGSVSLSVGTLPPGGSCTFAVNVQGTTLGLKPNTVIATAAESGAATGSAGTAAVTVIPAADLALTKTATPPLPIAGAKITYTVTATNTTGPSDAATVSLSDALPANTTFVSNGGSAGWTCTNPPVGSTGTIACTNPTFAVGSSSTFTIVVKLIAGTAPGTVISNTANVSSATLDPNSANNSATATVIAASPSQAAGALILQINASTAGAGYRLVMANQLQSAQTYLGLHTTYGNQAACAVLNSFKMLANMYSTIPSTGITPAMAADWNAQVDLIRALIPC